jgi:glycosyltransferase involved in cell wall biosynthesis
MSSAIDQPSALHFMVESPPEGATFEDEVRIDGWCVADTGGPITIRLRAGDELLEVLTGTARPDVGSALPHIAGASASGFSAEMPLAPGKHAIAIDARAGDRNWCALGTRSVVVTATPLRASLDTPSTLDVAEGPLRFSGWCAHPKARVVDLHLMVGAARTPCQYGSERGDVAAALPEIPAAGRSGFEATLAVAAGTWPVALIAVLENGRETRLDLPKPLRVRGLPLVQRMRRAIGFVAGLARFGWRLAFAWVRDNRRLPRPTELPAMIRFALDRYRNRAGERGGAPPGFAVPEAVDPYQAWQSVNTFTAAARSELELRLSAATNLPLLSVVTPIYNPPLEFLAAAVESVFGQVYASWELCMADDASTDPGVREFLEQLAQRDRRVRVQSRERNGNISAATNSAAQLASGEFVVLLDQDDLLTPDALAEIALCAAAHPDADIIYSDDDKIDSDGRRFAAQFKPDWSPELLLGYMYFSHVFAVRRSLYERCGGMRLGFEGSQDYDFALRASEQARAIAHVPQVLYHWRVLPGSTASSGAAKPQSFDAGRRAVQDALQRRGITGNARQPEWARKASVGIFGIEFPDHGPKVSVIIPTRNGLTILRRCIDSLTATTYTNYEVIVVDNDSDDPATLEYLKQLPHRVERISNPHGRFNFAWINNRAAERASGDLLLFLNNDTEVIAPRWLSQMVGYAGFSGVGAVGARLLFPDQRIQHAGIVHGYYRGLAGPAFKLAPAWDNGYLSYARVARNYSAVTAACLLTPRAMFTKLGGFDEVNFEVAYNDVDYCYRLGERGLRSVYCADAELFHHEGHSRGFFDRPQEVAAFRRKYAG